MIRQQFQDFRLPKTSDFQRKPFENGLFLGQTPTRQIYVKLMSA